MKGGRILIVNQINAAYIPVEDRLLLRINTQDRAEIRFWLTRSIVLQLLLNLSQEESLIAGPACWNLDGSFSQAVSSQQSDFTTQYISEAASYPLGDVPLLVTKIVVKCEAEQTVYAFELATNQTITINFDSTLAGNFHKLLCDVVKTGGWNPPKELFSLTATPFFNVAESKTVH